MRVNGEIYALEDVPSLDKNKKHTIDLVVDRLVLREGIRQRLAQSVELALNYGQGSLMVLLPGKEGQPDEEITASTLSACPLCKVSLPALTPQLFSFNGPQGACPRCLGLGTVEYFEPALVAPNRGLSLKDGALLPWKNPRVFERYRAQLGGVASRFGVTLSTPLSDYPPEALAALFYGEEEPGKAREGAESALRRNWMGGSVEIGGRRRKKDVENAEFWPGVVALLEKGMQYGDAWRDELSRYRQNTACPVCKGARLNEAAQAVRVEGLSIVNFCDLSIQRALAWMDSRSFSGRQALVAEPLLKELRHRLRFMVSVGLEYLSLGRNMATLSGGEAQRIRLASQLGSGLVGVTYVLDEPSIGLHPRDNKRLLGTLRDLQRRGNTVLVVEHDEATIREAWLAMPNRHTDIPRFAVIAYGKLGGKELGYASDLDLIFLYDDDHADAPMLYARLAQRFITWMTTSTSAGRLFDVDIALRPDGASGLMVSSLASFEKYQKASAWTWEHQALTRARFCAGDATIGEGFEAIREAILRQPREAAPLCHDVLAIREKIHDAHPNRSALFDLKHDTGGMIDIEFAVQYLVLKHAVTWPELTGNIGNIALLVLCGKIGLIPPALAQDVADIYRYFRRQQHQIRMQGADVSRIEPETARDKIAKVRELWEQVFSAGSR